MSVVVPSAGALAEGDDHAKTQGQHQGKQGQTDKAQGQKQAQKKMNLSGTVQESRQSRVGAKAEGANQVVLLETEQGKRIAVDLGPSAKLKGVDVKKGTPISVSGSVVSVEGSPVFLAERIQVGERAMSVNRSAPNTQRQPKIQTFTGTIAEMKEMGVRGTDQQHQVAVLQTSQKNRKLLVDLGPKSETQSLNLAKGDQAKVSGIGMNINERRVLIAQQVQKNGSTVEIDRESLPNFKKAMKSKGKTQPK